MPKIECQIVLEEKTLLLGGGGWMEGVEVVLCNVEPAAPHVKEQKKKNNQVLF